MKNVRTWYLALVLSAAFPPFVHAEEGTKPPKKTEEAGGKDKGSAPAEKPCEGSEKKDGYDKNGKRTQYEPVR